MQMNVEKYLAIDPGGTTGHCFLWADGTAEFHQISAEDSQQQALYYVQHPQQAPEVIIMESFILHPSAMKKSRAGIHAAVETIGTWRATCNLLGLEFVEQTPAMGKRITNEDLKDQGLYVAGLEHARDAARHMFLFLAYRGELNEG